MSILKTPNPRRVALLIALVGSLIVVVLAVAGIVIGGVAATSPNDAPVPAEPTARPTATGPVSEGTDVVETIESIELTPEGWVPVPVTDDPKLFAQSAARAVWSVDTDKTTKKRTLEHLAGFTQPTPQYQGDPIYPQPTRSELAQTTLGNTLMTDDASFLSMQTAGTTVTSHVVDTIMDQELSEWPTDQISNDFARAAGVHTVTVTLEVNFDTPSAAHDPGERAQRVMITVAVRCDGENGVCGVSRYLTEPLR